MTPQERELLQGFLTNLSKSPSGQPDGEADALIKQALSNRPDAPYILVQQVLLQQLALQSAQAQIAQLQQELNQAKSAAAPSGESFLGGAVMPRGGGWQAAPPRPVTAGWNAAPSPPQYEAPAASGFSSFLRSAASTAAGVAGGALLFEGIERLLGPHAPGVGFGGRPTEFVENTTVINEYASDDDNRDSQDNPRDDDSLGPDDDESLGSDDGDWA